MSAALALKTGLVPTGILSRNEYRPRVADAKPQPLGLRLEKTWKQRISRGPRVGTNISILAGHDRNLGLLYESAPRPHSRQPEKGATTLAREPWKWRPAFRGTEPIKPHRGLT